MKRLVLLLIGITAIPAFAQAPAAGQAFPSKPFRFVVPFSAGSATDQASRYIGQKLTDATGQAVIVDNRPGGNGIIGVMAAKSAAADGYTVLMSAITTHAGNPGLIKNLPYDAVKDFTALTGLIRGALVMVVNPALPFRSVSDVIAAAKKEPGKYTFASGNFSTRGGAELFKMIAGIDLVHVPYKGVPPALTDIVAGRVDMAFPDMVVAMPLVRAGRLRALAVSSATRSPIAPDLPTIAEAGVPGYAVTGWVAAWLPAGVPVDVVTRLNRYFVDIMNSSETREYFARDGWESFAGPPESLVEWQRTETEKWARIIEVGKIQAE
ncbi:MAG: Bug family tripartite tricarboxylate transporter substrate binding protein [Burkholderiales bacterium]